MRRSCVLVAPKTARSGAPSIRSTTDAASSPRAAAWPDSDLRASLPVSHGTAVAARSSAARRISPEAGSSHQTRPTVVAPTTTAMANGGITRRTRSCRESTSWTNRARRSPLRNAGSPAGASASRRWYTRVRRSARTRKAASWPTRRSP